MKQALADDDTDTPVEPVLVRFADLKRRGIVNSRSNLHRLINDRGFPQPLKGTASAQSAATFLWSEVVEWVRQRAASRSK